MEKPRDHVPREEAAPGEGPVEAGPAPTAPAPTRTPSVAGPEMAEALTPDVLKLVGAGSGAPVARFSGGGQGSTKEAGLGRRHLGGPAPSARKGSSAPRRARGTLLCSQPRPHSPPSIGCCRCPKPSPPPRPPPPAARPIVRKKAALCLLRLLRKTPPDAALAPAEAYAPVACALLEERDVGVLLAGATLLLGAVSRFGPGGRRGGGGRFRRLRRRRALAAGRAGCCMWRARLGVGGLAAGWTSPVAPPNANYGSA